MAYHGVNEVFVRKNYEDESLSISNLTSVNTFSTTHIDMNNFRHIIIMVEMTANTGTFYGTGLENLRVAYSLDDADYYLGEEIALVEKQTTGTYQGIIRLRDVGARYIKLYSANVGGTPTAYTCEFSRTH